MIAKPRSWWQKFGKPLIVVAITILVVGVLALVIFGYLLRLAWTGFFNRTLWDWLQLLIVPIMLAVGGFWLNQIQKDREEKATIRREEIARKIARDNQQETTLQAY